MPWRVRTRPSGAFGQVKTRRCARTRTAQKKWQRGASDWRRRKCATDGNARHLPACSTPPKTMPRPDPVATPLLFPQATGRRLPASTPRSGGRAPSCASAGRGCGTRTRWELPLSPSRCSAWPPRVGCTSRALLPAWACIVVSAFFASIAHEVEHDLIHSLYFPRQSGDPRADDGRRVARAARAPSILS